MIALSLFSSTNEYPELFGHWNIFRQPFCRSVQACRKMSNMKAAWKKPEKSSGVAKWGGDGYYAQRNKFCVLLCRWATFFMFEEAPLLACVPSRVAKSSCYVPSNVLDFFNWIRRRLSFFQLNLLIYMLRQLYNQPWTHDDDLRESESCCGNQIETPPPPRIGKRTWHDKVT